MRTHKTAAPILTLRPRPGARLPLPPRAVTRVQLIESAGTLRHMQPAPTVPTAPAPAPAPLQAENAALKARVAHLEAQAHAQASAAWLEAEAAIRQQRQQRSQALQRHRELARVHDCTRPEPAPEVVITTDAVRLRLPLDPRSAVPMRLPLFSAVKRWLFRRP